MTESMSATLGYICLCIFPTTKSIGLDIQTKKLQNKQIGKGQKDRAGESLPLSVLQHVPALTLFPSSKTASKQFLVNKGDGENGLALCLFMYSSICLEFERLNENP